MMILSVSCMLTGVRLITTFDRSYGNGQEIEL